MREKAVEMCLACGEYHYTPTKKCYGCGGSHHVCNPCFDLWGLGIWNRENVPAAPRAFLACPRSDELRVAFAVGTP